MKKISNVFLTFILFISVMLCGYLYQMETSKVYDLIHSYQINKVLRIPEGISVDKSLLHILEEMADKHGVIIEKMITTIEDQRLIKNHYTNMQKDKLNQIFHALKWESTEPSSYKVSTLQEDGYDGYIKDFLKNDYHRYFTLDALSSESYLGGSYTILADDEHTIQSFYQELATFMGVEESTLYGGVQESIFPYSFVLSAYFIVICILFFMVFLFVTFDTYNKSKRFGIYKLCGYTTLDILQVQWKKDAMFYISFLAIISAILLCIPQVTLPFFLLVFLMIVGIAIVNAFLHCMIVKFMIKKVKYHDLLKNKSLTKTMSHVAIIFKSVSVGILSLGFVFASMFFTLTKAQVDRLEQFSKYANYGFFEGFDIGEDQSEMMNGKESKLLQGGLKLYKELYHQGVLYADFGDFKEGVQKYNDLYIANVDTNYIEEFALFTPEGDKIAIDTNSPKYYYLIPTSKRDKVEAIQSHITTLYPGAQVVCMEYADKKLPTLNPNIGVDSAFMIDAPILKVITLENATVEDILAFGGYYDTPLKLKVKESKEAMFQKLLPLLEKYGLQDNLSIKNLVTYDDLFGQEIQGKKEQLSMLVTALAVLFLVIVCISFQGIVLYLKGHAKEIAVKRFIGTSPMTIFMKFLLENIIIMVLWFIVVGIIFKDQIYISTYLPFTIGMIMLDIAIISMTIKMKLRSFIITTLKGDQL